jgi:hypothetical protein
MQIAEPARLRADTSNHPTFNTHTYQGHIALMNVEEKYNGMEGEIRTRELLRDFPGLSSAYKVRHQDS